MTDEIIRFVTLFAGVFIGSVIGEYVVLRRHESDESFTPSEVATDTAPSVVTE